MLRKHQLEFKKYFDAVADTYKKTGVIKKNYCFAEVFPGGGKSLNAILAFKALKMAGVVDKLLWIVPRSTLKDQGAEEFLKPFARQLLQHNLEIRPLTKPANETHPCRDTDGYITTYQALMQDSAKINEAEMNNYKYLVYLDECHHICKETSDPTDQQAVNFFKATKKIVDRAAFYCGVSGTMYRNYENEKVAYLPYDDNTGIPDIAIKYSFQEALADKAIIPCFYTHYDTSTIKYNKGDKEINGTRITNKEELFVALTSQFAYEVLNKGLQAWEDYRLKNDSRSKLIIIADSQKQCRIIEKILKAKNLQCAMAISDEDKAHDNIKTFKTDSSVNILITCQMAYEGLDCKQATHLICLTRIRSKPWLIQALTRVMRYDDKGLEYDKQRCFVFVPNDKDMIDALKTIGAQELRAVVIDDQEHLNGLLQNNPDERTIAEIITNQQSAIGEEQQSDHEGTTLSEDLLAKIRVIRSEYGASIMPEMDFYNMLRRMNQLHLLDAVHSTTADIVQPADIIPKTARQREQELRNKIQKLASKCDKVFGVPDSTWNKKVHNQFRYKSRTEMGEKELQQVYNWLVTRSKEEAQRKRLELQQS